MGGGVWGPDFLVSLEKRSVGKSNKVNSNFSLSLASPSPFSEVTSHLIHSSLKIMYYCRESTLLDAVV